MRQGHLGQTSRHARRESRGKEVHWVDLTQFTLSHSLGPSPRGDWLVLDPRGPPGDPPGAPRRSERGTETYRRNTGRREGILNEALHTHTHTQDINITRRTEVTTRRNIWFIVRRRHSAVGPADRSSEAPRGLAPDEYENSPSKAAG